MPKLSELKRLWKESQYVQANVKALLDFQDRVGSGLIAFHASQTENST